MHILQSTCSGCSFLPRRLPDSRIEVASAEVKLFHWCLKKFLSLSNLFLGKFYFLGFALKILEVYFFAGGGRRITLGVVVLCAGNFQFAFLKSSLNN